MVRLANQAAILSVSRLASYGLLLISPILLVRLLSMEQFGRYREFLLYASLLQVFAGFTIRDSLLYFVPAHPESPWRAVRQNALLTFIGSTVVVVLLVGADVVMRGALVGEFLLPLVIHTLAFVNLDFWEVFLLTRQRPMAVLVYSCARLAGRMLVVVIVAAVTREVSAIIWSLVVFEVMRLAASAITWKALDRSASEPPLVDGWRRLLQFCLPAGTSALIWTVARNLSDLVIVTVFGPARFGAYAIGRYAEPIVITVRNSITSVVLPEMVRSGRRSDEDPLALWRRATVINTLLLLPLAVLLFRYAEPVVVMLFGEPYREAAAVMQVYSLVILRECFDFAPTLRAINRTRPLVVGSVLALITCGIGLLVLLPEGGLAGAMLAFAIAVFVEAAWTGRAVMVHYNVRLPQLLPWPSVARVVAAALIAYALIAPDVWTDWLGFAGVFVGCAAYLAAVMGLLVLLRVPESVTVLDWGRSMLVRSLGRRAERFVPRVCIPGKD